jgi:hypothetical protein
MKRSYEKIEEKNNAEWEGVEISLKLSRRRTESYKDNKSLIKQKNIKGLDP